MPFDPERAAADANRALERTTAEANRALARATDVLDRYAGSPEARAAQVRRVERAAGELGRRAGRATVATGVAGVGLAAFGLATGGMGVPLLIAAMAGLPAIFGGVMLLPTRKGVDPARLGQTPLDRLAPVAEEWLLKRRTTLPRPAQRQADQVLARLHDLGPQLATLAANSVEAAEARRIIGESLPRLVDSWAAVPPAARAQDAGVDQALENGLGSLAAALADLSVRLASGRVKDLAVESRYLESRYREAGPGA
jgi:hypothetical protein